MTLKNKLRKIRLKRGLTQEQLANLTNITAVSIHNAEKEDSNPRIATCDSIAKGLKVSISDVWVTKSRSKK